jgi:hypothetical protein
MLCQSLHLILLPILLENWLQGLQLKTMDNKLSKQLLHMVMPDAWIGGELNNMQQHSGN